MPIFPSLPEDHQLDSIFKRFPTTAAPLLEYHDRVLRDSSPLTVAERELIAAYVSGLNSCTYCHGSHVLAASAFGIDESLFEDLMTDVDSCTIDAKLKPLLRFVRKLTLTPSMIAEAVYAAGWDEQVLFDSISVCGLFNLMNRIVEGTGTQVNPLAMPAEDTEARKARLAGGTDSSDPHRPDRSYSKLAVIWGIEK